MKKVAIDEKLITELKKIRSEYDSINKELRKMGKKLDKKENWSSYRHYMLGYRNHVNLSERMEKMGKLLEQVEMKIAEFA